MATSNPHAGTDLEAAWQQGYDDGAAEPYTTHLDPDAYVDDAFALDAYREGESAGQADAQALEHPHDLPQEPPIEEPAEPQWLSFTPATGDLQEVPKTAVEGGLPSFEFTASWTLEYVDAGVSVTLTLKGSVKVTYAAASPVTVTIPLGPLPAVLDPAQVIEFEDSLTTLKDEAKVKALGLVAGVKVALGPNGLTLSGSIEGGLANASMSFSPPNTMVMSGTVAHSGTSPSAFGTATVKAQLATTVTVTTKADTAEDEASFWALAVVAILLSPVVPMLVPVAEAGEAAEGVVFVKALVPALI